MALIGGLVSLAATGVAVFGWEPSLNSLHERFSSFVQLALFGSPDLRRMLVTARHRLTPGLGE